MPTPKIGALAFGNANGTTVYTIITPAANGTQIVGIIGSSSDTVDRIVDIWLWNGISDSHVASATVKAGSGFSAADGTDILQKIHLLIGVGNLKIISPVLLRVSMASAVTSGKTVWVTTIAEDL